MVTLFLAHKADTNAIDSGGKELKSVWSGFVYVPKHGDCVFLTETKTLNLMRNYGDPPEK